MIRIVEQSRQRIGEHGQSFVKPYSVILEIAGKVVATPAEVTDAMKTAKADNKNSVLVRVKSGDQSRFVALPVAKG